MLPTLRFLAPRLSQTPGCQLQGSLSMSISRVNRHLSPVALPARIGDETILFLMQVILFCPFYQFVQGRSLDSQCSPHYSVPLASSPSHKSARHRGLTPCSNWNTQCLAPIGPPPSNSVMVSRTSDTFCSPHLQRAWLFQVPLRFTRVCCFNMNPDRRNVTLTSTGMACRQESPLPF